MKQYDVLLPIAGRGREDSISKASETATLYIRGLTEPGLAGIGAGFCISGGG